MKNTNVPSSTPLSSTVRELGRSPRLVASTIAVGSGSSPRSLAANASASQRVEERERVGRGLLLPQRVGAVVHPFAGEVGHLPILAAPAGVTARPGPARQVEGWATVTALQIPADLLPADGRFGCGPSKIRPEALAALATDGAALLGTSHRQRPVRSLVGDVRAGLAELFALPDGLRGRARQRRLDDLLGRRRQLADRAAQRARQLRRVLGQVRRRRGRRPATSTSPAWSRPPWAPWPCPPPCPGADVYAWAHNETSTGAIAPVQRVEGADEGALVVVDGTSAAGGVELDVSQTDVYYFAPQKSFGSEGGLWFALLSPAAVERVGRDRGERALDPGEPQPGHRPDELPPRPDPEHARRSPRCS